MMQRARPAARPGSGGTLRNLKLVLSYEGTRFAGWQAQSGQRTAAGTLLAALEEVLGRAPQINAAGRTDAGVHAEGQVVNFRTSDPRPPAVLRRLFNEHLPSDVSVRAVEPVAMNFHARHSPLARSYRYQLMLDYDPLLRRHAWCPESPPDFEALARLAEALLGVHDFRSFADGKVRGESPEQGSQCRVMRSEWTRPRSDLICYHITADHFLWKQVRRLVGSMVGVGMGRISEAEWRGWLLELSREPARHTAPALGLFLESVKYPVSLSPPGA